MAREPKGFSKSASGAYTAEDVSYAKQVKQQLAQELATAKTNAQSLQQQLAKLISELIFK